MKRVLIVAGLSCGAAAVACGPFFPNSFLLFGQESQVLTMPRITDRPVAASIANRNEFPRAGQTGWRRTLEHEKSDLDAALAGRDDAADIIDQYVAMRTKMVRHYTPPTRWQLEQMPDGFQPKRFDLAPYREMLDAFPAAMRLYTLGAEAFRAKEYGEAEQYWNALLALPEGERRGRTVWAEFMLGRSAMQQERYDEAFAKFGRTREWVAAGFPDPLQLAGHTIGLEAQVEIRRGNFESAAARYVEQIANGAAFEKRTAYDSISYVVSAALRARPVEPALLEAPTLGPLLLEKIKSRLDAEWIAVMSAEMRAEIDLNRYAMEAYRAGDLEKAREWLALVSEPSALGKWVQAKLLLWDGGIDDALALMREVVREMPEEVSFNTGNGYWSYVSGPSIVHAESGVLQLTRQDYVQALDHFARSGYSYDMAYVAKHVLTIDELRQYLEGHANDRSLDKPLDSDRPASGFNDYVSRRKLLHNTLARRYARLGKWEQALPYYDDTQRAYAEEFVGFMRLAGDTSRSNDERTKAYWNAGHSIYFHGRELLASTLGSDWHPTDGRSIRLLINRGNSESPGPGQSWFARQMNRDAPLHIFETTPNEKIRVARHAEVLREHDNYHHLAAEQFWKCAELLPDNDPMTARALYDGGAILKHHKPPMADRFYKALVNRCRKLPIGGEADKKRWFPKTPPPLPDGLESILDN